MPYHVIQRRPLPLVLPARPVEYERSLASRDPQMACQWHPTYNGHVMPVDMDAGSAVKVWWRCERGHEWREHPGQRRQRQQPRWKAGNRLACPFCVGVRQSTRCAHITDWHDDQDAEHCRACIAIEERRRQMADAMRDRRRLQWSEDYELARYIAGAELHAVDLTAAVAQHWDRPVRQYIAGHGSFVAASCHDIVDVSVRPDRWVRWAMEHLGSTPDVLLDLIARQRVHVVDLARPQPYWPEALLQDIHGQKSGRQPWSAAQLEGLAGQLAEHLRAAVQTARDDGEPLSGMGRAERTRWITTRVCDFGSSLGARAQREVLAPITQSEGRAHARLDVVWLAEDPHDIVIEIDSTDKAWSLDKLRWARTLGAGAIWIRHEGACRLDPGDIPALDLTQMDGW